MRSSANDTTASSRSSQPPAREVDVLRKATSLLAERLPPGWSLEVEGEVVADRHRVDAVVELSAPDGMGGVLLIEAKRLIATRDVPALVEQLQLYASEYAQSAEPMVVARYLPPSTRASLQERGIAYADATGNLRVVLDRPPLFVRDTGADRDPWRGPGRPRSTLHGPPAARVVRALVDFTPPVRIPELASRAGASTGATYRVVKFLESEALIERAPRGPVTSVAWRRLLERWSQDYGFQHSNTAVPCLQPRGLSALVESLRETIGLRYALTGSLAAEHFVAYAPPRLAMVYVDDIDSAIERLGLRTVDSGANVLLATGNYDAVFERPIEVDGLTLAAPSQVAVDLLTGPGRSAAEAEALLDWMESNEPNWRH